MTRKDNFVQPGRQCLANRTGVLVRRLFHTSRAELGGLAAYIA